MPQHTYTHTPLHNDDVNHFRSFKKKHKSTPTEWKELFIKMLVRTRREYVKKNSDKVNEGKSTI